MKNVRYRKILKPETTTEHFGNQYSFLGRAAMERMIRIAWKRIVQHIRKEKKTKKKT